MLLPCTGISSHVPDRPRHPRVHRVDGVRPSPDQLRCMARRYLEGCLAQEPLLTAEDLPDLISDVVAAVWMTRRYLACPERYVYRACRNRLLRFLARKRNRLRVQREWSIDRDGPVWFLDSGRERAAGTEPDRQAKLTFIRTSMMRADGLVRLILHLRHDGGMTWSDISELTGISAPSARMKEQRFRRRVRRDWERTQQRLVEARTHTNGLPMV